MNNLMNIVKSTILRNKGKTLSIFAILILGLSSAFTLVPTMGQTIYGQNPNAGETTPPATVPGNVTQFGGGIEIVEPTAAQLAQYNLPSVAPDVVFTIAPNPVGVGQNVQIIYGLWNIPPVVSGTVNGLSTGSYGGWGAFQITVTSPNGTQVVNVGPPDSLTATSGSATIAWAPTTTGTYTITCNWLGEIVANTTLTTMPNYNNYYHPVTESLNLTVQQSPIQGFNEAPVPTRTQYWTSPICADNRGWNVIDGPWLLESYNCTGKFNPYTYAPDSAHILWTDNLGPCVGGNVGGDYGPEDFKYWSAHQTSMSVTTTLPICFLEVINGYAYFNTFLSYPKNNDSQIVCMNIFTGKVLWQVPGCENCAQISDFRNVNVKYPMPMLWYINGNNWFCYDANTGTEMFQVTGCNSPGISTAEAPVNMLVQGPVYPLAATDNGYDGGGDLFVYTSGTNSTSTGTWICKWSANLFFYTVAGSDADWVWPGQPTTGLSYPWKDGLVWNVTAIPYPSATIQEVGDAANGDTTLLCAKQCNGQATPVNSHYTVAYPWTTLMWCVDQNTGALIWSSSITAPPFSDQGTEQGNIQQCESGAFTMWVEDNGSLAGFNEYTGKEIWLTQVSDNTYGDIGINPCYGWQGQIATCGYGYYYIAPEDGHLHCINMTTGAQVWDYATAVGGLQMTEPNYPIADNDGYMCLPTLADQKIFFTTGKEHEANPYWQGHLLYCVNAFTGVEEWNLTGNWGVEAIADGVLLGEDSYQGILGAICRGPSQTTVSAPQTQITEGNQVVIQGTITDQSPALKGTPCMADSCMSQWMAYELMDQPFPSNAAGVPISITAIDPNGNFVTIGNVTSDVSGNFHFTWTPPDIPGTYTLTATMNPTNSYYGSSAETTMIIVGPSTTQAAPTTTPTSVADLYFVPAIAGIIVVIIIGFIVLALLMLRKRP